MKKLKQKAPKIIGSGMIFWYKLLSRFYRINEEESSENYNRNKANWDEDKYTSYGFIEHQNELKDLRFGRNIPKFNKLINKGGESCCANNSCGIIALYNLLKCLKMTESFPDLIREIEPKGAVLGGYFGVSPHMMIKCLEDKGLETRRFKSKYLKADNLDASSGEFEAFLMFAYNDGNDISNLLHHVCIVKRNGYFKILNANDDNLYDSLSKAVWGYNNSKGKPILVTAVRRRQNKSV